MFLDLILTKENIDQEYRYQFHKINTYSPLSDRQMARHLLEFGYSLMSEFWRQSTDCIMGKAAFDSINHIVDNNASEDVIENFGEMHQNKPSQFLSFFNPVREYGDLISHLKRVPQDFFSFKIMEYVTLGGFPKVGINDLFEIVGRDAINLLQWAYDGTITAGIDLNQTWNLYQAQNALISYEKSLDKKMLNDMENNIKNGVPLSLREFEINFASTFKTAVDSLGDIEKFKSVREQLYESHETMVNSGHYLFPVLSTVAHFRNVSDKKIKLYDSISKLDISHELEVAYEEAQSNPEVMNYSN